MTRNSRFLECGLATNIFLHVIHGFMVEPQRLEAVIAHVSVGIDLAYRNHALKNLSL